MAATRRQNDFLRDLIHIGPKEHAALTATTTIKIFKARRAGRLVGAYYQNVTGLAADATNKFALTVQNGATVMASGVSNTDPDLIAADTPEAFTLSAVAGALNFAAGDVLSLVCTEAGTATLPAGSVGLEIEYT